MPTRLPARLLLLGLALTVSGCLPYSYVPNHPHVTTVAAKGQVEVAATASTQPVDYGQAELHIAAAPANRLLLTGHASLAGANADRYEYFIFFGNSRSYYNLASRHLAAGLGLGTFGKLGANATWYAQAGVDYARVSTEYRYGYRSPELDSGYVKAQGHFWVPWQQVSARFGLSQAGQWPRWSLVASLKASQLVRNAYTYRTDVVNGEPLTTPEAFAPRPVHLVTQAMFGGELALDMGLSLQATIALNNRQNANRLVSYGFWQLGLGLAYCFGNRAAWAAQTPPQ